MNIVDLDSTITLSTISELKYEARDDGFMELDKAKKIIRKEACLYPATIQY